MNDIIDQVWVVEKAIGMVFDLSLKHVQSGDERTVDIVKDQVIAFLRNDMDEPDLFYLYHPELFDMIYWRGEQVAATSNYETDGWKGDLTYALKQTLYVLGAEDYDLKKYLICITDRIDNARSVKKLISINDDFASVLFLGLGNFYNKDALSRFSDTHNFKYRHLDDPRQVRQALKEFTNEEG